LKLGLVLAGPILSSQVDFAELCAWAADNGYSATDIPRNREDAFDVARRAGLEIGQGGFVPPLITDDPEQRKVNQARGAEILKGIADKGGVLVGLGHSRVPDKSDEENVELFRIGVTPVAEQAEKLGLKLVMENYHNYGRNLAISPRLLRMMFAAVPDSVGFCFDPSHFVVLGIDWLRALHEFAPRVYYAHAKDTEIDRDGLYDLGILAKDYGRKSDGIGWWRYTLPGFGEVDWGKYVGTLRQIGYDGALAVEHEDDMWGWRESFEKTKKGLSIARKYLDLFVS
jgi:sugar phosphate isomerase/epimerase